MRIERFGEATLYLGDAREIAPDLARGGVRFDCLVSDPPYRLVSGGNTAHPASMQGGWMKDYRNTGAPVACDIEWEGVMDVARLLVEQGDIYLMSDARNLGPALAAAGDAGLRFHNVLVWDKRTATANRWYMKNVEFCLYLYAGKAVAIADCGSKALVSMPQRDVSDHPTEKPVALMGHWIRNSCPLGGHVVDPFMGSGTTGVAALNEGRAFTGVEIDERWFDVACRRMEAAAMGRQAVMEFA